MDLRKTLDLLESKNKVDLVQTKLPYDRTDLDPVMSSDTLDYHYGKLYKGYVDRYNKNEGDPAFNEAGAFLHSIFFSQFNKPGALSNKPTGAILDIIMRNHKSVQEFRDQLAEESMKIQGSAWIYLSKSGQIKTITNHAQRTDIALLIDWWEHAWALDYQADKAKYLKNLWRIIDWDAVNRRL
ncbi:SodA Superoxide dismutase [uncultured Caudovirales phage]|uniref:superoxide dismutase n=1 Tax=uncultured Caudovirales phage TaxID=2100421 RepID=A0A6J5L7W0_9CAUD|nr:SodA Superoxide dismutase [uncultured Caudovirales phage]